MNIRCAPAVCPSHVVENARLNELQSAFHVAGYAKGQKSEQLSDQFEAQTVSQDKSGEIFVLDNNVYPFV